VVEGVLRYYVTALCFVVALYQDLPVLVQQVLTFLAGPYAVPTALAMSLLVYWFGGKTMADRATGQRAVLRGLMAACVAGGLAVSVGLAWQRWTSELQVVEGWACWRGLPSGCPAAAVGFALGATFWRWNWRQGLWICAATGVWIVAQACCGVRYPLDALVGTVLGVIVGWSLGSISWLDRPLGVFIRLARWLMLA
jgi:hypothetical protein